MAHRLRRTTCSQLTPHRGCAGHADECINASKALTPFQYFMTKLLCEAVCNTFSQLHSFAVNTLNVVNQDSLWIDLFAVGLSF